jgi:hypothetical protein
MLSSSFLTQRLRDKAIAQQVQQKNQSAQPIIIPQAGYGSYTIADVDNGAINAYNKVEGGRVTINPACECASIKTAQIIPDNIIVNILLQFNSSVTIYIELQGNGTIYWGDNTSTPFSTGNITGFTHTYFSKVCSGYSEEVTINIIGFTTTVKLSQSFSEELLPNYTTPDNYPFVQGIIFIKADYLITLVSRTNSYINNFGKATALLNVELEGPELDLSLAGGSEFSSLTQLQNIYLRKINSITSNSQGEIINTFPNAIQFIVQAVGINITGIDTFYASNPKLKIIEISNFSSIIPSNIPQLPSTLLSLNLSYNNVSLLSLVLPSGLQKLIVPGNNISSLPSLPLSLIELNISDTLIANVPVAPNLVIFNMSGSNNSNINMGTLSNLSSTLQILNLDNTGLIIPLPIDFAIQTPQLKELYISSNFGVPNQDFDSNFPSTLEILQINGCQVKSYPSPFPVSLIQLEMISNKFLQALDLSGNINLKTANLTDVGTQGPALTNFGTMPNSLESLDISNCDLTVFPNLSNTNLITLNASNLLYSGTIPNLPNTIQVITFNNSTINNLPLPLPLGLISLNISACNNLTSLPSNQFINLPNLIKMAANISNINNTPVATPFPDIPLSLQSLDLSFSLTTILPLNLFTSNLLNITLQGCANITKLTDSSGLSLLPNTLKELNVGNCQNLGNPSPPAPLPPGTNPLPLSFPNVLELLVISNNAFINIIPSLANTQITYLQINDLPALVKIPNLPSTIQYIFATNGTLNPPYALTGFDDTSLENTCLLGLYLVGCINLDSLPILPDSLQALDLLFSLLNDSILPPIFPNGLTDLLISNNNFTQIPSLANTKLQNFIGNNLTNLISIPTLPSTILYIELLSCSSLNNAGLPSSFPNSLLYLALSRNSLITVMPSLANTKLQSLVIQSLSGLILVPNLPSTIISVDPANTINITPYALQGFADTSLASFTILNTISMYNMKSTLFVSPFPILPSSILYIDLSNGIDTNIINNQSYVEDIATNIVNSGPGNGGIFNISLMGLTIPIGSDLEALSNTYSWNIIT